MKWTEEAESALKKVPFFVRKKVRVRVEKEAEEEGKQAVSVNEVKATQKRYLSRMESEIKGYQIDICFGPSGCPNQANSGEGLMKRIESVLKEADLLRFLKEHVNGDLKYHHEFRISLADCPNACSQPQIKDIGIIGACIPAITDAECTLCSACVSACKEDAVSLNDSEEKPVIHFQHCVSCGKCIQSCPTGTLAVGKKGFRVQLGGKLGRRPRLARELPGIHSEEEVLQIIIDCIKLYKRKSKHGERFAEIFTDEDLNDLTEKYRKGGAPASPPR
ncbi:MAG: sulfite reductase [Deltaproteobacteria bacterium RBG_13_49_15]|nr:MAG: sulfite reductase [Deltaproteobacteria bacterium RBG_13_49_15]